MNPQNSRHARATAARMMRALLVSSLLGAGAATQATPSFNPPAGSDAAADQATVNSYVQDVTSDGLSQLNMILCVVHGMAMSDMLTKSGVLDGTTGVTQAQYIALVDQNKCDSSRASASASADSGGASATSSPNLLTATVNVSRGSGATDPMVGKVWISMMQSNGQQNFPVTIYAKLTATQSPTALPPYGQMRLDYAGYSPQLGSSPVSIGYIDANGGNVSHYETGSNSSDVMLAINAIDTNDGSGKIQAPLQNGGSNTIVTYTFAYNANYYVRNDGSNPDMCFDRSMANAQKSVWSYGTYDATTYNRIDAVNPGFALLAVVASPSPFSGVAAGSQEFGYAGYYGINFGNIDPNAFAALPDGQITAFSSITDQRPNKSTSYHLYKNSGRLTQWTRNTTTLASMNGVPFSFFGDGCQLANGNGTANLPAPDGTACTNSGTGSASQVFQNWTMQWNSTLQLSRSGTPVTGNFQVVGMQSCGSQGCIATTFSTPMTVVQGFQQMAINGYSDSLGQVVIPLPPGDSMATGGPNFHQDTDPAYFYTQSTVYPGSNPLTLYCLSNCPTASSLAAYFGSASVTPSSATPYAASTSMQWGTGSTQLSYTFGSSGLLDANNAPVVVALPISSAFTGNQTDVMTGRFFASSLTYDATNNPCPGSSAYCEPGSAPAVYYTYQTGPNQWDETTWLTDASTGTTVSIDPPVNVPFAIPNDTATFGTDWAGKSIQLQFNGFGNLYGIPGFCVDPTSNAVIACNANARYVPAFSLPDGTALSWNNGSGTVHALTLGLNAEIRLSPVACSTAGLSTSGVNVSLPSSAVNDPSLPGSSTYIGTQPTISGTPSVIDGVVQ